MTLIGKMKDYNSIIFDFDGTLFDTMFMWQQLGIDYLCERGITPNNDIVEACAKLTLPECAEYFIAEYNLPYSNATICADLITMSEGFYCNVAMPKPFVPQFLQEQADQGVKMCIATATERPLVEAALKRCKLSEYFCDIITCTQVGKSKRYPDIYNIALTTLNACRLDTIVIEDTFHAVQTAKNDGYFVVAVQDNYNDHSKKETQDLCDVYIDSFQDLLKKQV
ncbi:MAG: HAD hydrolase-like protein [Clostridia bacterium]